MTQHLPFLNEASSAFFELLMALDDTGLLCLDRHGDILYANEAFANRIGYTQSYLLNNELFDLEEGLTLLDFKKRWNTLEAKGHLQLQLNWKSASGKQVEVQLKGHILTAVSPAVSCWRFVDSGNSMHALRAAKSYVQRQGAAAWQWDMVGGQFEAETGFFELLSPSSERASANKKLNLLSALRADMPQGDFQELMDQVKTMQKTQGQFTLTFEKEIKDEDKDTDYRCLLLYAEPVIQNKVVTKIRGLLLPCSSKEASFDLLAKEALHRSDAMICWIRPDCSLSYANQALCQRLGYSRKALQGDMEITDIDAEHTREQWENIWDRVSDERTMELEGTLKTKEERVFPAAFYINYLDIQGEKLISLSARDITERRRKETDLQQALLSIKTLSEQLEAENVYLKEEASADYNFEHIITRSPDYKKLLEQIERVASAEATVLIEGETGTGKELLAHAIHNLSNRKDQGMVRVNCAALSEDLILSELFGHEKGAFTGADARKIGRFELADRGTLFLDEVGETSPNTQAKLLRTIQEGEFERLGGVETIQVDVRLIAATNRDLRAMVKEKTFREDLYYRLSVFPLHNLPLRKRKEDIPLLVQHFMQKFAKKNGKQIDHIRAKDLKRLQEYDFPGNIRELMNIVEQAVVLSRSSTLDFSYWQPVSFDGVEDEGPDEFLTLEEIQRQHIIDALEKTRWRVTGPKGAADLLGLKGQTLFSKMKKLGIERE